MRGFTLIELMVTLAILAMLLLMAAPSVATRCWKPSSASSCSPFWDWA